MCIYGPPYNLIQLETDRVLVSPKPQNYDLFCHAFDNFIYVFFTS